MPSNQFNSWRTGIQIDNIYPVGSIYMSVNATDPGTLFGGSWEAIENTFLVAQGSSFTAGSIGGTTTHTHTQVATTSGGPSNNTSGSTAITIAQMPSHNHGGVGNHEHGIAARYSDVVMPVNAGSGGADCSGGHPGHWLSQSFYASGGGAHTHSSQGSGSGHTHTLSSHTHSTSATTTGSGNNLPPYMAVYMWKRTA